MGHILEQVFWITGSLLSFTLAGLMHVRRLHKVTPWFCAWIDQVCLSTVLLFLLSHFRHMFYAVAFWSFNLLDVGMQIAVVLEFARIALKRGGTWVAGTLQKLLLCATLAVVLAAVLALKGQPAATTHNEIYFTRLELFSSVLIFLLAVATLSLAYTSGAMWRANELSRLFGFLAWSGSAFLLDTFHVYWRMATYFSLLEATLTTIGIGVLLYWIIVLPSPKTNVSLGREGQQQLGHLISMLNTSKAGR